MQRCTLGELHLSEDATYKTLLTLNLQLLTLIRLATARESN